MRFIRKEGAKDGHKKGKVFFEDVFLSCWRLFLNREDALQTKCRNAIGKDAKIFRLGFMCLEWLMASG